MHNFVKLFFHFTRNVGKNFTWDPNQGPLFRRIGAVIQSLRLYTAIKRISSSLYKGHSKRNEPEALKKKRAGIWNVQTGDNIVACVRNSGSDKSAEVHCPPLEGHGCKSRD